jgi:hypothetical protein
MARLPVEVVEVGDQVGLGRFALALARGDRLELLRVSVTPASQPLALARDVGLVGVGGGDGAEGLRELALGAVEESEIVRELHGQPSFSTRAAPTL